MQRAVRRVVVTGIGLVTPLGVGTEESWQAAIHGKSGIGPITHFETKELPSRIAGEVRGFDAERFLDKKEVRRNDPFIHYALAGAQLALQDAALPTAAPLGEMCGVIVGSGMGGLGTLEETHLTLTTRGHRKISPFFIPSIISNLAAGQISIRHGAMGINLAPVSACATGNHAIGESLRHIQHGDIDLAICGGSEATITPLGIAGFIAARALSERNDAPDKASRPFDLGRDGFVPGEGAGILILEELEHARARGARIYCEVVGYAATADAFHITQPSGTGAVRAMRRCLDDAGLKPEQIGYVNAHGTSTPVGDIAETKALKEVFGAHAKGGLAVSSTKSMTGHLLGAAGGVEAAFTALALFHGILPPTINLESPDPECDSRLRAQPRPRGAHRGGALNSFGFGGTNAVIAFARLTRRVRSMSARLAIGSDHAGLVLRLELAKALRARGAGFVDSRPRQRRERRLPGLRRQGLRRAHRRPRAAGRAGLRHRDWHEHRGQQDCRHPRRPLPHRVRGPRRPRPQRRQRALPGRAGHRARARGQHPQRIPRRRLRGRAAPAPGREARRARPGPLAAVHRWRSPTWLGVAVTPTCPPGSCGSYTKSPSPSLAASPALARLPLFAPPLYDTRPCPSTPRSPPPIPRSPASSPPRPNARSTAWS